METQNISKKRIEVFIFTSSFTLVMMGVFAGAGYLLDKTLGTWPICFVVALVLAYPAIQFYLYKKYKAK